MGTPDMSEHDLRNRLFPCISLILFMLVVSIYIGILSADCRISYYGGLKQTDLRKCRKFGNQLYTMAGGQFLNPAMGLSEPIRLRRRKGHF